MYKCIVIDDDRHAITSLEKYIEAFPGLELVCSYIDPLVALNEISKKDPVDLILLDIDMPKINGIELSREIRNKTDKLVFTTSHVRYGYDAFKVNADDYLLKPFTQGEFMISISKIFTDKADSKEEFFFVKNKEDNHKMVNIKFKDVVAVESKLNYIMIHTTTKQVLTYMSLNEIAKLLSRHSDFVQFHRSFIISYPHIDYFDGKGIRMDNGLELTVGQYYRKSYNDFIAKHLIKGERR